MKPRSPRRALEITTAVGCKNACDYCPQRLLVRNNKKRGGGYLMTRETFEECLDRVPRDVAVHFSGFCEPWQNPDCTSFVEYVAGKGHAISVFTTLLGVTEDDVRRLAAVPLEQLTIHLPNAEGSMKIDVDDEYLGILELVHRTSFQCSKFSCMFLGEPHPEVLSVISKANRNVKISRAGNIDADVVAAPASLNGPIACKRFRQFQNVLLPSGDVAVCCMDYGLQHIIGNLLRNSYEVLHRSPEFLRFMRGMAEGGDRILCRSCEWAVEISGEKTGDREGGVVRETPPTQMESSTANTGR